MEEEEEKKEKKKPNRVRNRVDTYADGVRPSTPVAYPPTRIVPFVQHHLVEAKAAWHRKRGEKKRQKMIARLEEVDRCRSPLLHESGVTRTSTCDGRMRWWLLSRAIKELLDIRTYDKQKIRECGVDISAVSFSDSNIPHFAHMSAWVAPRSLKLARIFSGLHFVSIPVLGDNESHVIINFTGLNHVDEVSRHRIAHELPASCRPVKICTAELPADRTVKPGPIDPSLGLRVVVKYSAAQHQTYMACGIQTSNK